MADDDAVAGRIVTAFQALAPDDPQDSRRLTRQRRIPLALCNPRLFYLIDTSNKERILPQLQNFPVDTQAAETSCWACAGRMIVNYYRQANGGAVIADDETFAQQAAAVGNGIQDDLTVMQSASQALINLGYLNNTDGQVIPTQAEISEAIDEGKPLLAAVSGDAPPDQNSHDVQGGHWVVITAIMHFTYRA